jgi:hypothetical protein
MKIERKPTMSASASEQSYAALGDAWANVPPAVIPVDEPPPIGFVDELRAAITEFRRALEEITLQRGPRETPLDLFRAELAEEIVGVMSGTVQPNRASVAAVRLAGSTDWNEEQWPASARYAARLDALLCRPWVTSWHLARLFALHLAQKRVKLFELVTGTCGVLPVQLLRRMARSAGDLRPVLAACAPFGAGAEALLGELLQMPRRPWTPDTVPPLWQTVAAHLDLMMRALRRPFGRDPAADLAQLRALELVALLPTLPMRLREALEDLVLVVWDDRRGPLARALVGSTPKGAEILRAYLNHRSTLERAAAIRWMGECGERSAIPLLRARLAREKRDDLRADLRRSLAALGEHLSGDGGRESDVPSSVSEQRPHAVVWREDLPGNWIEAQRAVERCRALDQLPGLTWADGRTVPAATVREWVVSAAWYRSYDGDAVLTRLLRQLSQESAEALALHVLSALLAYDVLRPSEAEAKAYADGYINLDRVDGQTPAGRAARQAHAKHMARHRRRYLQSGYDLRGLLGVVWPGLADECLQLARVYFREHWSRTGMIHAMLLAFARCHAFPGVLELMHEVAITLRNKEVRRHVNDILDSIAEETGCTRDDLADRAVPTLGLDERASLVVRDGERLYTAVLAESLRLEVWNESGQTVVRLPAEEAETRQTVDDLHKVLQTIVLQQTARLQLAMRTGRLWRPDQIRAGLFRHPIVGKLCQRLIFAGVDADGRVCTTFRVLEDGSCVNLAHEAVDFAGIACVRIAHTALLTVEDAGAWRQHLLDHEVVPLFMQLW